MTPDAEALKRANMTQTQLLMYTAQKLSGRRPIYNMGMAIQIASDLDAERFRKSFDDVVRASDNMRSVFRFADGGPRRMVLDFDDIEYDLPVIDFSDNPELAAEWMQERLRERIVLTKRLFNSALLRIAADEHIWFICQHHLICDGVSFANLVSYVGDRYAQLEAGDKADMHIPAFGDFVEREVSYYASDECAESGVYWDAHAANTLPEFSLYGLGVEDGIADFTRIPRRLDGALIRRMKNTIAEKTFRAFSEDQGLFLIMVTALIVQLRRASGNDRFAIGIPLHNRPTPQDKAALGSFFICSALHVHFDPDDSFADLYTQVSREYRKMLRHYRHPVVARPGERSWDVTINFVNKTFPEFAGNATKVTWLQAGAYLAKAFVGIQIHRFNAGDGMTVEWDFNLGIFGTEDRQETAMRDFETAIEFGLSNPDSPLEDFL